MIGDNAPTEAEATATVIDMFTGARDVTDTQPSSEVVVGFHLIEDWNNTPDPGTADSPYCRCGRRATAGNAPPRCLLHDGKV